MEHEITINAMKESAERAEGSYPFKNEKETVDNVEVLGTVNNFGYEKNELGIKVKVGSYTGLIGVHISCKGNTPPKKNDTIQVMSIENTAKAQEKWGRRIMPFAIF